MINGVKSINSETLHSTLIRLARTHKRRVNIEFTKILLTEGQPKILYYISENSGCIQREIAERCNIEPATVTSIVTGMENIGLIYRTRNDKDKRIMNVYLTEKGNKAQKEVAKILQLVDNECFAGFTEEEKIQTVILLNRLYENIIKED